MSVSIDWAAFVQVFAVALVAASVVVGCYATGLRLLVRAGRVPVVSPADFTDAIAVVSEKQAKRRAKAAAKAAKRNPLSRTQKRVALAGAYTAFGVCALAVLAGIVLIVVGA